MNIFLAKWPFLVPVFIFFVLFLRTPSQIFDPIVAGIAVPVTALESIWARTHKRLKHKSMNSHCF